MMAYNAIFMDLVGKCNAKCHWCITGLQNSKNISESVGGGYVDINKFSKAIDHMRANGIIDEKTNFQLYNWGEPFMHPEFKDIMELLYEKQIYFGLSTNVSIPVQPFRNKNIFRRMTNLTFSMCGFSQKSYDRIHKLNFESVKKNMISMKNIFESGGYLGIPAVAYHIYQFNQGKEIEEAIRFCETNNILFSPSCAYFNDFERGKQFLKKELPIEEIYLASKDLCLYYVEELLSQKPKDYVCPQLSALTLDENLDVLVCCAPKDEKFGSVLNYKFQDIVEVRKKAKSCADCMKLKLDYWVHNPKRYDYVPSTLFQARHLVKRIRSKVYRTVWGD